MGKLMVIGILVILINIPFGYWRANVKRLSLQWLMAIHLPVIIVIMLRLASHLGFAWFTYLILVTAFIAGQQFGALTIKRLRKSCIQVSSCLVMDILRCCRT